MNLSPLAVLSDPEIKRIHEATVEVLEECGVEVDNPRMLAFLGERGLPVDTDRHVVRLPRAALESALETVPATFEVFDRDGNAAFVLGDGQPKVAAGHNAVFWVDSDTGETRPSTVADVELFARLCDSLPVIDMIAPPVMPQDGPDPAASLLYGVRACIENSRKPLYFSTDSARVNGAIIEMLRATFQGNIAHQVYGISQLSPTSPLSWERSVIDAIMDTAGTGVPLAILPEPNAGVSAPFTLAGLLVMNNAECLSGLAMIQMLAPGAKVLYANSWTTTDMRSGSALVGSIETSVCRVAGAQLARFYGIPCHTTAPNSDNHAHDEQNSWEKTFSQMCAIGAGNDLVVNCGMFACGMTCSQEQLLMDAEISEMCRRLAAGLRVSDETIAVDLIKEIGPHGSGYLTADHTFEWLRSDEYLTPKLAVRGPRSIWEGQGSPDTYQLARKQVAEARRQPAASPLDDERRARLADIVAEFERG